MKSIYELVAIAYAFVASMVFSVIFIGAFYFLNIKIHWIAPWLFFILLSQPLRKIPFKITYVVIKKLEGYKLHIFQFVVILINIPTIYWIWTQKTIPFLPNIPISKYIKYEELPLAIQEQNFKLLVTFFTIALIFWIIEGGRKAIFEHIHKDNNN